MITTVVATALINFFSERSTYSHVYSYVAIYRISAMTAAASDHRVVYFSELQEQVTSLHKDKRWLQSQLEEKKLSLDQCRVCYRSHLL